MNSIRNKVDEVFSLLNFSCLDLYAITESKLDPNRDIDGTYLHSNYSFVRHDRLCNGGGIVVYIKNCFNFEVMDCPIKCNVNSQEMVIKINYCSTKFFLVSIIYSHPSVNANKLTSYFHELNCYLFSLSNDFVVLGDFNLDLLKKNNDSYLLRNSANEFQLTQLISGPTFKGLSLLDHVYVSKKTYVPNFLSFPTCLF